jgi:hypothetical protein
MTEDLVGRAASAQELAVPIPGRKWQGDGKAAKTPGALEMERDLGLPEAVRDYAGGVSG